METGSDHSDENQGASAATQLLDEVGHIFSFAERREQEVLCTHFGNGSFVELSPNHRFREAAAGQYFDEDKLRRTCVKYRLRFLPSSLYSGAVPFEVIACMKRFEHKEFPRKLSFYILAPIEFYLKKQQYRSPLLFAEFPDGKYAMLCQWGDPRPWYQEVLRYPFRDMQSLMVSSFTFGFLVCFIAGISGLANGITMFHSFLYKVPLFVLSAGFFSTASLIYGLVTRTDFSSDNWNKQYFRKSK
ncbi:MAG: hypothetical protein ACK5B6_06235 [Bacteroidia bacterium]